MACPYIDQQHAQCQPRMRLDRLAEAIAICGHDYQNCPTFKRLQAERQPELVANVG